VNGSQAQGTLSPSAARIHGWAIMLAPLLLLASTVTFIYEGGINNGVVGGTIGVWSTFAFAIGIAGIYRLLEPRAPRIAPVFMAIALIGFVGGAAFNIQAMYLAGYGNDLLTDITEGRLAGASTIGTFAFLPWGLLVPVTLVATGILLWRTRTVPTWSAALLVLGGVLFVASRPARIDPLALAADAVLVLALAPIGWSMMTRSRQATAVASSASL
jgi:glucan phosphoethanolaminetransferase (alkaline phosphatase superfamily)